MDATGHGTSTLDLSLLDGLLEGVQVISPEWRYLYVNDAAAQHGRTTPQSLVGRTMMEAFPGIDEAPFFTTLRRCMTDRTPATLLNRFDFPDGGHGWFELRIHPVPAGVCILSVDVSRQRRAEEQFHAAQRMESVGRLAGGVAHDFNNLLSVILTYAGFVLEALPSDSVVREDVEEIRRAGLRAADLTRQLLAFCRNQVLKPQPVDLDEVISGMSTMLRRVVGEDIDLRLAPAPDLPSCLLDRGQLEQVVMNLVVNARDAMPAGGTLTLETAAVELDEHYVATHFDAAPGRYVMLAVSDTGIGMDEATRVRIFEPFFTTKPVGEGTGLGLATVFGIVRQSGGSVYVYSEPGKGATFRLYFPAIQEQATPPLAASRTPVPRTGRREVVLVVEDERAVNAAACRILTAAGYSVLAAHSLEEARALAASLVPPRRLDLLLTDLVLPGAGGTDVASAIAALHPAVRVVFMSGYTQDSIARHGLLAPGLRLLAKPFNASSLAREVREALDAEPSPEFPSGAS